VIKKDFWVRIFHSFGNDAKIDLYVDKMEVSIPLIKDYRNKIFY